jgi:hypothetical protein
MNEVMRDTLFHAQAHLGLHRSSDDVSQVIDIALQLLVTMFEEGTFPAALMPSRRARARARHRPR